MADLSVGIEGIQEAQQLNLQAIAALRPSGGFGRALKYVASGAHRYTVSITHVKTGALRASHRIEMNMNTLRGEIYIDPSAVNPLGKKPSVYGPKEHGRGGEHAFYARTIQEAGPRLVEEGAAIIKREIRW